MSFSNAPKMTPVAHPSTDTLHKGTNLCSPTSYAASAPDSTFVPPRLPYSQSHRDDVAGANFGSAITRSEAASAIEKVAGLSPKAVNRIMEHTLRPLLAKPTLKDFEPIVLDIPRRIRSKEIICLRDLEKTFIFMAPVSQLQSDSGVWGNTYKRLCLKEKSKSATMYLDFCLTSIQCIEATAEYISDREQTRQRDRPYTNGYFIDLRDRILEYGRQLAAAKDSPKDIDIDVSDEIKLVGGIAKNSRPTEPIRVRKDGTHISMSPGKPVDVTKAPKIAYELEIIPSMACRRKNATPKKLAPRKCREPGCNRKFKRPCDLAKHEKTHSRPYDKHSDIPKESFTHTEQTNGQTDQLPDALSPVLQSGNGRDMSAPEDSGQQKHTELERNDGQFTDSGYESTCFRGLAQGRRDDTDCQLPFTSATEDDAHTVYSAETVANPRFANQCILDLCKDIHAHIWNRIGDVDLASLQSVTSDTIKSFAIQIGISSTQEINRKVMYFIHNHHQKITTQLHAILQNKEDDSNILQRSPDSMSLHEKMNLWLGKSTSDHLEVNETDHFQGVEDMEEEHIGSSDLLEYTKEVLSSSAYIWLLESLTRKYSLFWGNRESCAMIDRIRKPILTSFPKTKISKRRAPDCHGAAFWIPFNRSILRTNSTSSQNLPSQTESISNLFVLTSSAADQIQATTIRQYFEQTWASSGLELLRTIQEAMEKLQHTITSVLADMTEIRVSIDDSSNPTFVIGVHVLGSAHSIAELGEQLAWFGTSLQLSVEDSTACSSPHLIPTHKPLRQEFWGALPCHQNWEIGSENQEFDRPLMLGAHWDQMPFQSPIISGFPTLRRPSSSWHGVEVSKQVIYRLIGPPNLELEATFLSLQGLDYKLCLVKRSDEVLSWHMIQSHTLHCACNVQCSSKDETDALRPVRLTEIWSYRHIVEPCTTNVDSTRAAPSRFISKSIEKKEAPAEKLETSITISSTASPSSQTSFDSDMLSISDRFETASIDIRITDARLILILNSVKNHFLSEYRNSITGKSKEFSPAVDKSNEPDLLASPTDNESSGHSDSRVPPNSAATREGCKENYRPLRKRGRDDEDENSDKDKSSQPPSKRSMLSQGDSRSRLLACPFWKDDSIKHKNCFSIKLTKISYVKQHLVRNHKDIHCERCFTVFSDDESHQSHMRHVACTWDPSVKLDGISNQQQRVLSGKSKSKQLESEQWFNIWDIVFPNKPRPTSPYLDSDISEDLSQFLDFFQREGSSVLANKLRANGMSLPEELLESCLQHIHQQVCNEVYEQWRSERTTSASVITNRRTKARKINAQITVDSTSDSGVGSGSNILSTSAIYNFAEINQVTRPNASIPQSEPIQPLGATRTPGLQETGGAGPISALRDELDGNNFAFDFRDYSVDQIAGGENVDLGQFDMNEISWETSTDFI